MIKKIKILYTIPNFDSAGSGLPLLKIVQNLDKNIFSPEIACLHKNGYLFQEVRNSGVKVHIIDLYKKAKPRYKFFYECFLLSKIFKKISPDIIHSYHYAADYSEPIAARMAGVKWVYTKKNMSWKGPSYRGWKLRSILAHGIIAQNSTMMKRFFYRSKKVQLIPIGVDTLEYKKKEVNKDILKRWNIDYNDRLIISVASLIRVKGLKVLINAFVELAKDFPEWKLMIVGDSKGNYAKELFDYVENIQNMKSRIIFTGKQKNVRELLDLSEIYVQPTLNKGRMEGAPISILEAMANEKLVIGSNIPGIKDQLKCFSDHLFIPGNHLSLKTKLIKFMSNNIKSNNNLGKFFYNYVFNKHDISIEKKNLQMFYKKIV